MRFIDCDIVVVGAGPAGSLAARTAAEKGAKVLLLEEHQVVGSPVSCAEGLSLRGIIDAGLQPVEPYISQKVTKANVYAPNLKHIELTSENWVGYNLNRNHFDKALGDNAVKAGAELLVSTSASSVIKDDNKIIGVKATQNNEPIEIHAKVTIGADGYQSIIRRSAGMERFYSDYCSCAQYTLKGLDLDDPQVNGFYLGVERCPGGYVWVFPKNEDSANVGVGVRKINDKPAIDYLEKFIKKDPRFKNSKVISRCGGITPVSGQFDRITLNGLMLVGDAAGQVVSLTGAGIHSSIEAGKIAGSEAVDAIVAENLSESRLNRYSDKYDVYWGKRIRDSRKMVEMLDKFSDEDLNALAEVIKNDEILSLANGEGTAITLAKIISRSPGKIVKLMAAYLR